MQTRSLRTLAKIARIGSFAATAEQLNMTLSAVSMQMKTLERDLDVALFDRSFRPPKLTPQGRAIAGRAERLLTAEDELLQLCSPGNQLVGRFRIGFIATASVRLLPDFLRHAGIRAPRARFDLETGLSEALEEKVLGGQLDAAVVTASGKPDPQLDYLTLRVEPLVYALPAAARDRPLDDLVEEMPFLHFAPGTGIGKLIAAYIGRPDGLRPRNTIVLDGVEAIVECVKSGLGLTLLPAADIGRYADERLATRTPQGLEPTRKIVLATLKGSAAHGRRALLEALFR
ncbi:LysR family transcriptional regulator [Nitratireductor sp. XY-223]|uniref:LysR family transcriptional regulator n=1 Tax=Nitratireductor sp. XY-223 TaxID=2561926 RepID=UPI0010AAAC19|nr:LysR family transcriptional regulator [Nitratireductor sp. XY-223]